MRHYQGTESDAQRVAREEEEYREGRQHARKLLRAYEDQLARERPKSCQACRHSTRMALVAGIRECHVDAGGEELPVQVVSSDTCNRWEGRA